MNKADVSAAPSGLLILSSVPGVETPGYFRKVPPGLGAEKVGLAVPSEPGREISNQLAIAVMRRFTTFAAR